MCCGLSGVLFSLELVEGKDHPSQLGPAEYNNLSEKSCGLLLHMLKSVFHLCQYIVLDCGFCILCALVELRKKGVFAAVLIKM